MIRYLVGFPRGPQAGDWVSTGRHHRHASPGTPKVFCPEDRRSICRLRRAGFLLGPPAEENGRLAAKVASFAIASCADTLVLCVPGGEGARAASASECWVEPPGTPWATADAKVEKGVTDMKVSLPGSVGLVAWLAWVV